MNDKEIVRAALAVKGVTMKELAERAFKPGATSSYVSEPLTRKNGMRIDLFHRFLSALGYEIIVRDIKTRQEWTLDMVSQKEGVPDND